MPNKPTHKDNLVFTAMRLFRRQGYASTGLQQILAESKAPKGSLYYYFPSGKEGLAVAAVEMAGDLICQTIADLAVQYPDPEDFVPAYCDVVAGWMEDSDFRSGCPIATTMLETAPQSPPLTEAGAAAMDRWMALIAEIFMSAGILPEDAQSKAAQLVGAIEGALIIARIRQSTQPIKDVAASITLAPAH